MPVLWLGHFGQDEDRPGNAERVLRLGRRGFTSRHVVRVRGCAPADDFGDQGDSYVVHAIRRNEQRRSSCASHSKGRHSRSASARHCAARTAFIWKLLASVLLCVLLWSPVFGANSSRFRKMGVRCSSTMARLPLRPALSRSLPTAIRPSTNTGATRSGAGSLCHRHPRVCCGVREMQPPKCRLSRRQLPDKTCDREICGDHSELAAPTGKPSFQLCRDRQHHRRSCRAASCRSQPRSGCHQSRVKLQPCGGFAQGSHGINAVDACHGAEVQRQQPV